jgi:DNA-binding transcriptional ArsR family regulator
MFAAALRTLCACLLLAAALASRAAPSAPARAEIDHLLGHLAASGCEFYRNGKWYPASQAREHLQKKYEYLLKKDLVDTAEQFIDRAASESSRSGEAYRVRCGGASPLTSREWLGEVLQRYRAAGNR